MSEDEIRKEFEAWLSGVEVTVNGQRMPLEVRVLERAYRAGTPR